MKNLRKRNGAFTLIELIVVVAIVAMLAASLLPALAGTKPRAQHVTCTNNLKQVGLAFRTWAIDQSGNMPMQVSYAMGGDADDVGFRVLSSTQKYSASAGSRGVSMMFLCLSNQLRTPKARCCGSTTRLASNTSAASRDGPGGLRLFT